MPTQPIEHKGYNYNYAPTRKPREDVDFPLGPEQSKKRQETGVETRAGVRDRIRTLLADVPRGEGNKVSFRNIAEYRDSLEKDWDALVSHDLAALGVDMSVKFRLMHDGVTGDVLADGDHPDKGKIDQYFASNPDMARDFGRIVQLGKLVDVAERKLTPQEMGQTLDTEAMAWWYQSNMDTASLFTGGGIVFGMGSFAYKGLGIRV